MKKDSLFRIRDSIIVAVLVTLNIIPGYAGRCGTPQLFQQGQESLASRFKIGAWVLNQEEEVWARTYQTKHFLIHYTLRGAHKVRTSGNDSITMKSADSLFKKFKTLPTAKRDSTVYAELDRIGADQPEYIKKTGEYFENAWKYYVLNLGMKTPTATITTSQYLVSKLLPPKFPVDIVDMETMDSDYGNQTYAVCFPPPKLSIALENDFLWNTSLDSLGNIQGLHFLSKADGKLIHDYFMEWEMGLQVTVFHEFYHAIQFTYIPRVTSYHAWYEISAVGMEERNAPDVNDYFQYVPCIVKNPNRVSLTSMSRDPCTHPHPYGNSLFHIFLGNSLDSIFDVKVWDELSRNGNALPLALESTFKNYGENMVGIYKNYSTQLFFSGNKFHSPLKPFSPDLPKWSSLATDSVDLTDAVPYRILSLPSATFAVLKIAWNSHSVLKALQTTGVQGMVRIHANADTAILESLGESQLTLLEPKPGFGEYYLVIPNSSFTEAATVEIRELEGRFFAFPNPVRTTGLSQLYFSRPKEMSFPARVEIYTENGVLVRSLTYPDQNAPLVWNLKSTKGEMLTPGIYYYRLEQETLRPLILLR